MAIAAADEATRKTLFEARAKTDVAVNDARRIVAAAAFPGRADVAADVDKLSSDLAALRSRADSLTSRDKSERTAEAVQVIVEGVNDLIGRAGGVTNRLEQQLSGLDAEVARPASIAQVAWSLRDNAGRQSILFLQAINSLKPATPDIRRRLEMAEGAIDQVWQRLTVLADAADSPPRLRQSMIQVREGYFAGIAGLRQRVTKAGLSDGAYDIDGAEWRRISAPMLQCILSIRDAAITQARDVADVRQNNAKGDLIEVLVLLAIATAVFAFIVRAVGTRVSRPLAALTETVGELARGDHNLVVPTTGRPDEIGSLAEAIEILRASVVAADVMAARERTDVAAKEKARQRLDGITRSFAAAIDSISAALTGEAEGIRSSAGTLTGTAEAASRRSTEVAAAAEQATANVQTAAAAAGQLASSIGESSRRVSAASSVSDRAVTEAEHTGQIVAGLTAAAGRIAEVVKFISSIAAQTNLLALNATIEAARAGEAGKGFAVVANEVKALARRTTQATDDIHSHVDNIRTETNRAVEAIRNIARTIGAVNGLTASVAAAVEQQGAATHEIARNVQEAAVGTARVSASIGQILDATRSTREAVDDLVGLADDLTGKSVALRKEVGGFISRIRAGS